MPVQKSPRLDLTTPPQLPKGGRPSHLIRTAESLSHTSSPLSLPSSSNFLPQCSRPKNLYTRWTQSLKYKIVFSFYGRKQYVVTSADFPAGHWHPEHSCSDWKEGGDACEDSSCGRGRCSHWRVWLHRLQLHRWRCPQGRIYSSCYLIHASHTVEGTSHLYYIIKSFFGATLSKCSRFTVA